MSPGRPYDRTASDSGESTLEWRVARLEEADKNRVDREEAWRAEVRAVHTQILTQQALTNQTLGQGDRRMDEIDVHLVATDKDVVALKAGHAELRSGQAVHGARIRALSAGSINPRVLWTAISGAATGIGGLVWKLLDSIHATGNHP